MSNMKSLSLLFKRNEMSTDRVTDRQAKNKMPKYILYSMMVLALALRSWRLSHFKAFKMSDTLLVLCESCGESRVKLLNRLYHIDVSCGVGIRVETSHCHHLYLMLFPSNQLLKNIYLINTTLMPKLHHIILYSTFRNLRVTKLVFNKNWQGISQSPVGYEFHREATVERWNGHSWQGIRWFPVSFL